VVRLKTFLGYPRPDGSFGIRNWVLIIPAHRTVNILAAKISELVNGTKVILTPGEEARPKKDRETIGRTLVGLGMNSNTAGVLIIGLKQGSGYPEVRVGVLAEQIRQTGKPVRVLTAQDAGGVFNALGEGVRLARELVSAASTVRRVPCAISNLKLGVKCGLSDASSGISGNPVVGRAFDVLVKAGGTAFFSETTELIGAEKMVARRGVTPEVREAILRAVDVAEKKALENGEDIRTINPIPANIAGGITTLEEKSLGAVAKSGSGPIQGVLTFAEVAAKPGLYFVDSWVSSFSLPVSYAASGAQLFIYQMGGGDMPQNFPMPACSSGIVCPIMYATGNSQTYAKGIESIDFDSSLVMEGKASVDEMGDRMLDRILEIASGTWTKMESWNYSDPIEIVMEGPYL
jgi:altronate dehydratase large subunit